MKKQQIIKIIKENTISVSDMLTAQEDGYDRLEWRVIDGKNELVPMHNGEDMPSDENNIYIGHFKLNITPERLWDMDYDTIEEYFIDRISYIIQSFSCDEEI